MFVAFSTDRLGAKLNLLQQHELLKRISILNKQLRLQQVNNTPNLARTLPLENKTNISKTRSSSLSTAPLNEKLDKRGQVKTHLKQV